MLVRSVHRVALLFYSIQKCARVYRQVVPVSSRIPLGKSTLALSLGWLWPSGSVDYNRNFDFKAEPITQDLMINYSSSMRKRFEVFVLQVQKELCDELEKLEEEYGVEIDCTKVKRFQVDRWSREEGGGGITCILQEGSVFEKAGVNISVVNGKLPPQAVQQMRSRGKLLPENVPLDFFASGVSSVIHPRNPNVPTIHFNFRYFEVQHEGRTFWWFGGGTDLTPYILFEDDVKLFHQEMKKACDKHDPSYYGRFKKWCDEYFFVKHRGESRGVGGLFYDDIDYPNQEKAFAFVRDCARAIVPAYIPLVERNAARGYSRSDRKWQLLRRGRYVEFNLIYDRGTKFGLMTPGARYESILMSLPLEARWEYQHEVKPGSKEFDLLQVLREPKEWV